MQSKISLVTKRTRTVSNTMRRSPFASGCCGFLDLKKGRRRRLDEDAKTRYPVPVFNLERRWWRAEPEPQADGPVLRPVQARRKRNGALDVLQRAALLQGAVRYERHAVHGRRSSPPAARSDAIGVLVPKDTNE